MQILDMIISLKIKELDTIYMDQTMQQSDDVEVLQYILSNI